MESQQSKRAQLEYPLDIESEGIIRLIIKSITNSLNRQDSLTIPVGATSFVVSSNLMSITGAGAVTIATLTNGYNGQILTLVFTDANVTISDDNTHAENTIDLSAAFTSADDKVLQLVRDGTSWYEVARSTN